MKVSVCMATFNGADFIYEQVQSILLQLKNEDELIISDDGSSDKTIEIIESFKDGRIKIFNNQKHGVNNNFENALKHATGDYIYLSDQDDVWLENKINIMNQELESHDFVVSDCMVVDTDLKELSHSRNKDCNVKSGFINIMIRSRYLGCCMALKKEVLQACLPFPVKYKLLEHDIWIASVAELYYNCISLDEPLILYRRHGSNVSSGGFDKGYSMANKIIRRIYRIICLIKIRKKVRRHRNNG